MILNLAVRFRNGRLRLWKHRTVSVAYGADVAGWRLDLFGWEIDGTRSTRILFERPVS